MHQIKFYRTENLPSIGEIGSFYFLHEDINSLYVCINNSGDLNIDYENYSGHTYWSDDSWSDGGGGGSTETPSAPSNLYLPLTGGTMSGDINFNSGSILFGGGQAGSISIPGQGILQLLIEGDSLQLGFNRVTSNVLVNAPKFVNTSSSDSYVLLGGGGTKLLSEITDAYLPLTGGAMTGTITFNISDEGTKWIDFGQANAYIQPAEQSGLVLFGDGALFELHLNAIVANCNVSASAFYETSDIRKKNIKSDLSLDKCYDLIDKCQTVIYSLKDQTKEQVGMIALEIEEFFPEVVATDEEGFKSLAYDRLVVICFKVLKDVIKRLEKLENGL